MSSLEDLLLLLTDRDGHPMVRGLTDIVLAGAALGELARVGRLTVDGHHRIHVVSPEPGGDPLLDRCLAGYAARDGQPAKRAIPAIGKGLTDATYAALGAGGAVRTEPGGFLRRARHVVVEPALRDQLVEQLTGVLAGTSVADVRTGSLVGLLQAAGALPRVIDGARLGLDKRQLNARGKELADGDWATGATREAIKAAHDATMAVIVATTAATTAATAT